MSLLDIFTPLWKKQFDELVRAHRDELIAFLQNKYEIYPDMRIVDRIVIEEYKKNYDISKYPANIEELTNDNKKELVSIKDQIIRLAKVFSKYDSLEKRVKSLYERFSMNGIFDSVFKKALGNDYDINALSASQIEYVLNGYDKLVKKAFYYNKKKNERQAKLKEKLIDKVYESKVIAFLNKQKNLDKPLMLCEDNKVLINIVKKKIDILESKYSEFNVYRLVRRILLLKFDNFPTISKDIYILSKGYFFEESLKTFYMVEKFPVRKKYLPLYLMSTTNDHLEKLLINHDFEVLDEYIHNELQQSTCYWIESQNNFNSIIIDVGKPIIPYFRSPKIGTYVLIVNNNKNEIKKFVFVHFMLREYIKDACTVVESISPYAIYISSDRYRNMTRHFDISNPSTTRKILNLILTLGSKVCGFFLNYQFVVVLGSSSSENEREFNTYHFKGLINKLTQKGVLVVEYSDIDKIHIPKYIVILELFTEVKAFTENCKKLLYKFPGVAICYLSIYNEMTNKRYEEYLQNMH